MITVLGARGFIGSHLTHHLQASGIPFQAPDRDDSLRGRDLGQVIDCAGITADFRTRPYDTVDAHVCRLVELARHSSFLSFVYLSSTRLYKDHGPAKAREEDDISVNPVGAGGLYNLSKAMGEAVVHTFGDRGRVVRLSNVYGAGSEEHNFLASIITDALTTGEIVLRTSLESAKDYVSVADVVRLLPRIASDAREHTYNVASGVNVTNGEITGALARLTGCRVSVKADAETWTYPEIDIRRAREELGFQPSSLLDDLADVVDSYRETVRR
jgi:nucleoside-diphosphate-sugar epimerase